MIIGAGAAGLMLLKEYRTSYYLTDKVKIFIDDNEKNGTSIWMAFALQVDVTRSLPV